MALLNSIEVNISPDILIWIIPYRDIFLHYQEPDKRPTFAGQPKPYNQGPSFRSQILSKLGLKR